VLQLGVMKSNVESRIKNYEQDLSKFEARWHQLKPNEAALESGPNAGMQAVKSIKDKKMEFAELEKTREDLV
jgi:dynein heavy chain 2, cytosolic